MNDCFIDLSDDAVPIEPLVGAEFETWRARQDPLIRNWATARGFTGKPGDFLVLPAADGRAARVFAAVESTADWWTLGAAPVQLPAGDYRLDDAWPADHRARAATGWGLGAYRFWRYRTRNGEQNRPRLVLDAGLRAEVGDAVEAVSLVRDLINTPAQDMMPSDLAAAAADLAARFGGEFREVAGEGLLPGWPCLHAVGRASAQPPRRIEIVWGEAGRPEVVLIGKGVCFDSGGLDLKPSSGMRLMKKDMGGAAHVLGLARLIMGAGLPVRLRVLIGAAENAVSATALRPGDVIATRKGLTVEVENTDAEGRLAICDLLAEAAEGTPDLMIDFATLTGAARVAVGTEVGAFFSSDDVLAARIADHAREQDDALWRLPLHTPYRAELDSKVADLMNCSAGSYGGTITAALFLKEFLPDGQSWLHFDIMAWNLRARPGRPEGGEAMGVRAVFALLRERYRIV